jgi:hypothetical protein
MLLDETAHLGIKSKRVNSLVYGVNSSFDP